MDEIALPVRVEWQEISGDTYWSLLDGEGTYLVEDGYEDSLQAIAAALNDHAALQAQVAALEAERDGLQSRYDNSVAGARELHESLEIQTRRLVATEKVARDAEAERDRLREQVERKAAEWSTAHREPQTTGEIVEAMVKQHCARELRAIVGGAGEGVQP